MTAAYTVPRGSRPRLVVVQPDPAPSIPPMVAVAPEISAQAENLRGRFAQALRPLTGRASTDKALSQAKAELFALATDLQKLARRIPS